MTAEKKQKQFEVLVAFIGTGHYKFVGDIISQTEKVMDYLYPKDKPETDDLNKTFLKAMEEAAAHKGVVMVDWDSESEKQRNSGKGLNKIPASSDPSNFVQPGVMHSLPEDSIYVKYQKSDTKPELETLDPEHGYYTRICKEDVKSFSAQNNSEVKHHIELPPIEGSIGKPNTRTFYVDDLPVSFDIDGVRYTIKHKDPKDKTNALYQMSGEVVLGTGYSVTNTVQVDPLTGDRLFTSVSNETKSEKPTDSKIDGGNNRRTGKTTRVIDNIIQRLFDGDEVVLGTYDEDKNGERLVVSRIKSRLANEHGISEGIIHEYDTGLKSYTIRLDFNIIKLYKLERKN